MTEREAIDYINGRAVVELERDKSGKGWICPICNSGSGKKGTGLTTRDNKHFTCWARGCIKNESYIDILAKKAGIDPKSPEALTHAFQLYGLDIDGQLNQTRTDRKTTERASSTKGKTEHSLPPKNAQNSTKITEHNGTEGARITNNYETKKDYTADFTEWHSHINDPAPAEYLKARGITPAVVEWYNLGYCSSLPSLNGDPAIIIPTSSYSYNARNIKKDSEAGNRYRKSSGAYELFNIKALETSDRPIFIVEGEFDALSILGAGAEAIAIGGAGNLDTVILKARQLKTAQPLIIALDNDDSGKAGISKLKEREAELEREGLKLYFPDLDRLYFKEKDANDALIANDFYFENVISEVVNEASNLDEIKRQEAELELNKDSVANALDDFNQTIERAKNGCYIPTGFSELDKLLDGGLYTGLYIVGAVTSLGKTTLCLQIGDQIASSGRDVLIFSLEMSRIELIAKSISRLTSQLDNSDQKKAKTTRGILTGSRYKDYSEAELELIEGAKDGYFKTIAPHLFIYEGIGNIGYTQIRKKVEAFKTIKGKAPVVIIDYLQILAPAPDSKYLTDKQTTDQNVMELKRISRDYETTIIGISSFNRDNYNAPVNLASFKESGAIEYSSDVLIGLQYKAMDGIKDDGKGKAKASEIMAEIAEKSKKKEPVEIQLKVLKNRNGNRGTVELEFYSLFSLFKEPTKTSGETYNWTKETRIDKERQSARDLF